MGLGDMIGNLLGGGADDPKLTLLIDTNHKLTSQLSALFQNYTDQIVDLKIRVEKLEGSLVELQKR